MRVRWDDECDRVMIKFGNMIRLYSMWSDYIACGQIMLRCVDDERSLDYGE